MSDNNTPSPVEKISSGLALCLSGGGYRAMLFHLGALKRLNDAGYLSELDWISSVSGGSITAGVLGLAWPNLGFDQKGVGQHFEREVLEPVMRFATKTIDLWAILLGVLGPGTAGDRVARSYGRYLFGRSTLQDLPDRPRFVINASNLQSGALWRFSKPYCWDYRVGEIPNPDLELAVAVAASSAFPPFLSPMILRFKEAQYAPGTGSDLQYPPYTTDVFLTDGGVYDNLGLETAWKRYSTILVSDGGGKMAPEEKPKRDWLRLGYRVLDLIDNQVRSLRKRQVIESFKSTPNSEAHRNGTYWGIRSHIADYQLPSALDCPPSKTARLANVPTRLAHLGDKDQKQLINWGFAICDAAIRKHVDFSLPTPKGFPYPEVGVG